MEEKKKCPYVKKCGGCRFINEPYEESVSRKHQKVGKMLKPYVHVTEMVGMDDPYYYRNKVHRAFSAVWDGKRVRHDAGIYAEGTHKIVPVKDCLIEDREADAIMQDIVQISRKYKMKIYDEDTGEGLLRHVLIRTAHATGQIMVVLVLSSPVMPGKNNFVKLIRKKHPRISTIVINVNDQKTSMVLGDREENAYGRGFIEDELCGKRFRISSKSFYQVNSVQTERLYQNAIEWADLTGKETVLDAYCGIGTIGICVSDKAKKVIGCELNRDAVRDAISNAKRNGIDNARFYCEDAGTFLTESVDRNEKVDVIFMDPPRSGASEEFLQAAAKSGAGRIVYISCNPETLLRDLKILDKLGYKAEKARAYDMFPFTEHCEVIVSLRNRKP